jgi:hypothetical protein
VHKLDEVGFRLADAKDFSRVRMAQLVLEFGLSWSRSEENYYDEAIKMFLKLIFTANKKDKQKHFDHSNNNKNKTKTTYAIWNDKAKWIFEMHRGRLN